VLLKMALKATLSDIGIDDTHMHFKVKIQRRNMTATFILSALLENCRTTVSLSDLTIQLQCYSAEIERNLNYQSPIVLIFVKNPSYTKSSKKKLFNKKP